MRHVAGTHAPLTTCLHPPRPLCSFWDLASWQCVRKAEGHDDAVRVLAAADDTVVVSGAYDGAVGIW